MNILKFKKYISWNIISLTGYIYTIITIIFASIYSLAASGLHMNEDSYEYFSEYISKLIIAPYVEFWKFQIFLIIILLIIGNSEKKHYADTLQSGFRILENHAKIYNILFLTGFMLNFIPLAIVSCIFLSWLIHLIKI